MNRRLVRVPGAGTQFKPRTLPWHGFIAPERYVPGGDMHHEHFIDLVWSLPSVLDHMHALHACALEAKFLIKKIKYNTFIVSY